MKEVKSVDMTAVPIRDFESKYQIGDVVRWHIEKLRGIGRIVWKNLVDVGRIEYQVVGCPYLLWEEQIEEKMEDEKVWKRVERVLKKK